VKLRYARAWFPRQARVNAEADIPGEPFGLGGRTTKASMERGRVALRVIPGSVEASSEPAAPPSLELAFRKYSPYVAAVAMRLLGRDDDVDDVVQDVFLSAVKGLSQLRDPDAIKGWLATVTVRVARRKLRTRRVRSFLGFDQVPSYEEVASPGASPEHKAMLARVYAALDGLPVEQRIAWVLRFVEGEQLEDVARLTSCSLATAKRRISAAHQEMERILSDE
jgi:RNA polymerase sigma-70 factor (ECF subfamily)